jgi:hypothetical protein
VTSKTDRSLLRTRNTGPALAALVSCGLVGGCAAPPPPRFPPSPSHAAVDWDAYGRDLQGTRYLAAEDITRDNVSQLELAWTYRTRETGRRFATKKSAALETTPLVVDGDPLKDIGLLAADGRNLRLIMRAGELVKNELA